MYCLIDSSIVFTLYIKCQFRIRIYLKGFLKYIISPEYNASHLSHMFKMFERSNVLCFIFRDAIIPSNGLIIDDIISFYLQCYDSVLLFPHYGPIIMIDLEEQVGNHTKVIKQVIVMICLYQNIHVLFYRYHEYFENKPV